MNIHLRYDLAMMLWFATVTSDSADVMVVAPTPEEAVGVALSILRIDGEIA